MVRWRCVKPSHAVSYSLAQIRSGASVAPSLAIPPKAPLIIGLPHGIIGDSIALSSQPSSTFSGLPSLKQTALGPLACPCYESGFPCQLMQTRSGLCHFSSRSLALSGQPLHSALQALHRLDQRRLSDVSKGRTQGKRKTSYREQMSRKLSLAFERLLEDHPIFLKATTVRTEIDNIWVEYQMDETLLSIFLRRHKP